MFGARTRKKAEFSFLLKAAGFIELRWIDVNDTTFLLESSLQ